MPQLFQVLKCHKCSVFQVHQTKKTNKWECKLCGEKQSLKRHYGLGNGKECRLHVQKLNGLRGQIDEINELSSLNKSTDEDDVSQENSTEINSNVINKALPNENSKWSNFIEKTEPTFETETKESMYLGNAEVVLEYPTKKKRKFNTPRVKQKPTEHTSYSNESFNYEGNKPEYCGDKQYSKGNSFTSRNSIFAKVDTSLSNQSESFSRSILAEQQIHLSSPNVKKNDVVNKPTKFNENPAKTFIPPKLNKNSKWAQFTDDLEEEDQILHFEEKEALSSIEQNVLLDVVSKDDSQEHYVTSTLFALCDDDELDDVLAL